jgi:hypothetical protein
MKKTLIALLLAPCLTIYAAEKTTAQKVDAELTSGAKKIGDFFEGKKEAKKKKKKSPAKSAVESVNEAGDAVLGGIGEILGTQKK